MLSAEKLDLVRFDADLTLAQAKGIPLYRHVAALAGNEGPMVLPVPCFNVINGGSHAGNKLAFQEYFIIPVGATTFKEAMRIGAECYHNLKSIIKKKFGGDATLIGDEGGFAPPCDARQGVELIMEAIQKAGYEGVCKVGVDLAAITERAGSRPAPHRYACAQPYPYHCAPLAAHILNLARPHTGGHGRRCLRVQGGERGLLRPRHVVSRGGKDA